KASSSSSSSSAPPQRVPQARLRRYTRLIQPTPSSSSHPPPHAFLHADATITPWGGLSLSESSFTSIPPPPPPPAPPPPPPPPPPPTPAHPHLRPPAPPPQPAAPTSRRGRRVAGGEVSGSNPCSPSTVHRISAQMESPGREARELRARRRPVPRMPRLPPLRPISNLSFTRSFTFSFFQLPVHQAAGCRAERVRHLMLLLRQMQY
ncbi:unnamed protein product, partial [Merluccius merluccius]